DAGYDTGAFVSAFVLDAAWGLDRGFGTYWAPFHPEEVGTIGAFGEVEIPGADVVNAAVGWWRAAQAPRFAWIHLYDPHTPWTTHPGTPDDPYRSEVAHADGLLARLIREVGQQTLVVLTSDHGEGLWDHGEREHGVLLSRSATRVPLVIRPPGGLQSITESAPRDGAAVHRRPDGVDPDLALDPVVADAPTAARVVEGPVSGVDVAPTIAQYADISLPGDGRSLLAAVEGADLDPSTIYAETLYPWFHFGWSPLFMAQDSVIRLELGLREELSSASGVPGIDADDPDASQLRSTISSARGETQPRPGPTDPVTARALQALGYQVAADPTPTATDDPRDLIDSLSVLHEAESLDDPVLAVEKLTAIVQQYPDMTDARIALSLAQASAGQIEAALQESLTVLESWPEHPTALANAAALSLELEPEQSIRLALRMIAANPQDARGHRLRTAAHVRQEDPDGVIEAAGAGLKVAPEDPNLHYLLAMAVLQVGDPLDAVVHLEQARRFETRARDVDLWLAVAHDRAGRVDDALGHYQTAILRLPNDPRPLAMAGWMLYKADRCDEARPFLVNLARRGGGNDPKVREAMEACGEASRDLRSRLPATPSLR
ncbi:MAG: sulfatase-like hydrolase/transferase, partial [Myxococcota bacterium]|nr:sulfatase-like hydrolase/transferase [Myxococcota bacterium]